MKNLFKRIFITGLCVAAINSAFLQSNIVKAEGEGITTNNIPNWPQGPDISSTSATVIDNFNNVPIYEKNSSTPLDPGATVKIMTALLALEKSKPTDIVQVTETGALGITDGGTTISSQVGEELTMEQCLNSIIVGSANDIALQVAEHISGSVEAFVLEMNKKAKELGCKNTNFVNPTGLSANGQTSTSYDMALILAAASRHTEFIKMFSSNVYAVLPTNLSKGPRNLSNKFSLMQGGKNPYEGCIGGKEGFTDSSGNVLATIVNKNDLPISVVILKGQANSINNDAINLFDYTYNNFYTLKADQDDFSYIGGGNLCAPNGITLDNLQVRSSDSGENIIKAYYFGEKLVGTSTMENTKDNSKELKEDGKKYLKEAKNYSDSHGILPLAGIIALTISIFVLCIIWIKKIKK